MSVFQNQCLDVMRLNSKAKLFVLLLIFSKRFGAFLLSQILQSILKKNLTFPYNRFWVWSQRLYCKVHASWKQHLVKHIQNIDEIYSQVSIYTDISKALNQIFKTMKSIWKKFRVPNLTCCESGDQLREYTGLPWFVSVDRNIPDLKLYMINFEEKDKYQKETLKLIS